MSKQGFVTKKQGGRRETRLAQRQQRNAELQREQARKKRNRRSIQLGLVIGSVAIHALPLADHETIAILYNSSNIHPTPFTNWQNV